MMIKFNFSLKLWLGLFVLYSVGCITSGDDPRAGLNEEDERTCAYLLNPNNDGSSWCGFPDGCHTPQGSDAKGTCITDTETRFGKCVYDLLAVGVKCYALSNKNGKCNALGVCVPDEINDAKVDFTFPDINPSAIDTPEKKIEFLHNCNKMIVKFNEGQSSDAKSDLICMDASSADESDSRRRSLPTKGTNIQMQGAKKAPQLTEFNKAVSENNNKIGKYSAKGGNTGSAPGTPAGSSGIQSNSIISAFVFTLAMM